MPTTTYIVDDEKTARERLVYLIKNFLEGDMEIVGQSANPIEALKQISPITWSHINLYGKYNFSTTSNNTISTEKLNCILASIDLVS